MYADDDDEVLAEAESGRWPWFLQTAPGADAVLEWNLPDAAGDPLALLPLPIRGPLPDAPYPGLRRFTAADAPVFFGRGHSIRRLYERVVSPTSSPVILLHGQSGVGKSSILEAGLTPRLQLTYNGSIPYEVVTIRIDPVRGLLDSLRLAYIEDACHEDGSVRSGREAWCRKEARLQQPMIVILDQLEEAFTHATGPVPTDWDLFLNELCMIFNDRARAPRGKLILSFRTEWFSRINSRLQGLWKSEVFLDCLDADGIHEAIEGPTRRAELREYYPLTIQPGLSLRIATELLMDQVSSVAPSLQIVLQALWKDATRISRTPVFTEQLYRKHRTSLLEFVWCQVQAIAASRSVSSRTQHAIAAGLLEDFLECHVTPELTARQQTLRILVEGDASAIPPISPRYQGRAEIIRELRQLCIDHYLLLQPDSGENAEAEPSTRLAHDALAPHIRAVFESSDATGPNARRILEQRVREWDHGVRDPLDQMALKSIERGQPGMRDWTPKESLVVKVGRKSRLIRRYWISAAVATLMLIGYFSYQISSARQLEAAFVSDAASIESLFELCRDSPRVAVKVARRLLTEKGGAEHNVLRAGQGSLALSGSLSDERVADRRSIRAAMVLIELGYGDQMCYQKILERLGQIHHPESAEIAELKLIIQMTNRFLDSLQDHPEDVAALKESFAGILLEPIPDRFQQNVTDPSQRTVVLTAFLLAIGHANEIPKDWYEPSPDQQQRTQIIAQLHGWMTPEELLNACRTLTDTYHRPPGEPADDSGTTLPSYHLTAVLSLAIASAPEDYLNDVAALIASSADSATESSAEPLTTADDAGISDNQKQAAAQAANRNLLRLQYWSPSSALRSAARILMTRLHEVRPNLIGSLESLDRDFREEAAGPAVSLDSALTRIESVNGEQTPIEKRAFASIHGQLIFLRPAASIAQCDWFRVEFLASHNDRYVGVDFARIPEDPSRLLSSCWMSITEVPSEFYSQYFLDPYNPDYPPASVAGGLPVEINDGKPQTHVSASQAMRFCNWLSRTAALGTHYFPEQAEFLPSAAPAHSGFRLPFISEWEYACRARSESKHFHFGESDKLGDHDILGDYAWYIINSRNAANNDVRTCATKLPNAWGFFDMVGNAGEWRTDHLSLIAPSNPASTFDTDNVLVSRLAPLSDSGSGTRQGLKLDFRIGRDSVRAFAPECYLTKPLHLKDAFEPLPASKRGIRLVIDQMPVD